MPLMSSELRSLANSSAQRLRGHQRHRDQRVQRRARTAYWSIAGVAVALGNLPLDWVQKWLELVLVCGLVARRAVDRRQFGRHDWVTVPLAPLRRHHRRRRQLVWHGLVRHAVLGGELPALPVKEHLRLVTWLTVRTVHGG